MRMTKAQYLASRPVRERKPTVREVAKLLSAHVRRQLKVKGLWEPKPQSVWRSDIDGHVYTVIAHCKSDARGEIKKLMGIPKDGRLPPGIRIEKLGQATDLVEAA